MALVNFVGRLLICGPLPKIYPAFVNLASIICPNDNFKAEFNIYVLYYYVRHFIATYAIMAHCGGQRKRLVKVIMFDCIDVVS